MANNRIHEGRSVSEWAHIAEEFLHFNAAKGEFIWKKDSGKAKAGTRAGCRKGQYTSISLCGEKIYEHVLVLVLTQGIHPAEHGLETDHLNHDRYDNRPENLEVVTPTENRRRTKSRLNGKRLYISRLRSDLYAIQVPQGSCKTKRWSKRKWVASLEAALLYRALFTRVERTLEQELADHEAFIRTQSPASRAQEELAIESAIG